MPGTRTSDLKTRATLALSLAAAAVVAFFAQLALGVQQPFIILAINIGLAAGAYGMLLLLEPRLRETDEVGILQFVGFLAIALLGRVWLGQTAQGFAILFEYSLALGALAIAVACAMFQGFCMRLAPRRAALTNSMVGGLAFTVLAVAFIATSPTTAGTNLTLLGLTCIIVPFLLLVQWWVARRVTWTPAKSWATPVALALSATQLFDGVLTYLVLGDPFGIAPDGYEEQIPVSRFILERFGIGFPIAKWALALFVASILARARFTLATNRVAIHLAVLAAGMGPGLFTASQLF